MELYDINIWAIILPPLVFGLILGVGLMIGAEHFTAKRQIEYKSRLITGDFVRGDKVLIYTANKELCVGTYLQSDGPSVTFADVRFILHCTNMVDIPKMARRGPGRMVQFSTELVHYMRLYNNLEIYKLSPEAEKVFYEINRIEGKTKQQTL